MHTIIYTCLDVGRWKLDTDKSEKRENNSSLLSNTHHQNVETMSQRALSQICRQ